MRLIIFINQYVSQLLVCPIFPKNWTVMVLLLQKIIMILKNHFWMLWQLGVFGIDNKELKNKKTAVHLVNAQQFIMSYYPRLRWYVILFQFLYSKSSARNSSLLSSILFLSIY